MFYVGQKVTLKYPVKYRDWYGELTPVFGVVYTIRDILSFAGEASLRFYELRNDIKLYTDDKGNRIMDECHHTAEDFRPVLEKKTDISVFTELLNKQPNELATTV